MKLTLLFLIVSFVAFSQIQYSANTSADIKTILLSLEENEQRVSDEIRSRFPINTIGGDEYVSFVTKSSSTFNEATLSNNGVLVGSIIKDIVSIKYPLAQVGNILSDANFSYVKIAGKIKPLLNKVPIGTRADSVWMGYGLPQGYTGKDVIIGVTDWGFDYTSPMFYDTLLLNSRLIAAWDQFKTSGPPPIGYSYGTEYDNPTELINAGSDTFNIYSYHTHGTHVAGIAGGSGAGTPYRGIGFESEFLFTTFLVDEGAVLDAWQWMYDKANGLGKRLVINMSWGLYHMDAIDGTSVLSQALDAYSALNVVFATSAGNNGSVDFHMDKTFAIDTLLSKINFYTNAALPTVWGQSIHMWGEAGNSFSGGIRVLDASNNILGESPLFSTATTSTYIDSFVVVNGTDTVFYNLSADDVYPTNSRPQIRLRVKYPPVQYKIVLVSTALTGKVHIWNVTELTNDVGNWGMPFTSLGAGYTAGDNDYGIGTPACSATAIAVAAYSSEYFTPLGTQIGGAVASFSSEGPLMTEELKPDITAPGVTVISSISSFTDASYNQVTSVDFMGRTYPFAAFSGTSMSSPATVGVISLILHANPYLSSQQVKDIIIQTARTDSYTGVIPPFSTKWAWGKINAYAAVQLALTTSGIVESAMALEWNIYPNPTQNSISMYNLPGSIQSIEIIDLNGKVALSDFDPVNVDVSNLYEGTYFVRLIHDGKVEQRKFVKL